MFENEYILASATILRTVVATITHVLFTSMVAYAMSRPGLIGKKVYMKIAMITMFFNGGLIPNFILMIKLGLYDSFWVYILPGMFTFYNMVIFMSFFRTIPESLIESAIDGHRSFASTEYHPAELKAGHSDNRAVHGSLPLERLLSA
ncbi:MAG: hypothetical protein ACLUEK_07815 [Oscillospiraceae bacterium]